MSLVYGPVKLPDNSYVTSFLTDFDPIPFGVAMLVACGRQRGIWAPRGPCWLRCFVSRVGLEGRAPGATRSTWDRCVCTVKARYQYIFW